MKNTHYNLGTNDAGDSIIVPVLVSLLNPFVNNEHEHIKIVNEYVEKEVIGNG